MSFHRLVALPAGHWKSIFTCRVSAGDKAMEKDQTGKVTIADSLALYKKDRESIRYDTDQWIAMVQAANLTTPLENSTYLHALSLTDGMMRRIRYRFLMLTGACGNSFVSALKDTVELMLWRIRVNQGDARVIVINGDAGILNNFAGRYQDVLSVCEATADNDVPFSHFIVGDYGMVRQEEPHPILNDTSPADSIKAKMYFSNHEKVGLFTETFDSYWRQVSPVRGRTAVAAQ